MTEEITPESVYYIKLGSGGGMEKTCFDEGVVYVGFGSERDKIWEYAQLGRWEEMHRAYVQQYLDEGDRERAARQKATAAVNIIRDLFEDDGSALWTTFADNYLYWGFLENTPPFRNSKLGDGIYRAISAGWRKSDLQGQALTKSTLPGYITKKTAYRGTRSKYDDRERNDLVRRINGLPRKEIKDCHEALDKLHKQVAVLVQCLHEKDFEIIVDLIFQKTGWQRVGRIGGVQETVDIELEEPLTGAKAFVQVKSKTDQSEFNDYIERFERGPWAQMFYVFHTGDVEVDFENPSCEKRQIHLIDRDELAPLVVKAGLTEWLLDRTRDIA